MTPEHLADAQRTLAQCDARPDDPQAQAAARWVRKAIDGEPDSPIAARMRSLLSDYALALHDNDATGARKASQAIRQTIAAALVPGSIETH